MHAMTEPPKNREVSPGVGRAALWILASVAGVALLFGASLLFSRSERISGHFQRLFDVSSADDTEGWSPPLAALLARAEEAIASGELRRAEELYDRALRSAGKEPGGREGGDVALLRRLYHVLLQLGKEERAEEVLGILSFRGVTEDVLGALRGFLRLRLSDLSGARSLFTEHPENPDHAYGLLLLAVLEERHEEAPDLLAVVRQSADPLLQHAGAVLQGAYDEFALFQDGKSEHRATLLARALADVEQCPLARRLLEGVLAEDPDYRDAWLVLGYCRLMLQDMAGAKEAFEKAYSLDPEKAETQYFLGVSEERLGNPAAAKTYYTYALQNGFKPERTIREKLAALAIAEESFAEAAGQHRAILARKEEDHASSYRALVALFIERLGDPEEAEKVALQAREEYGDTPLVLDLLGWSALARGKRDEAATYLTVAVQQDGSSPEAWYHRAALASEVGDRETALSSYRKAYERAFLSDPDLALRAAEKHNALMLGGE